MRSDELVTEVRMRAFIGDSDPNYTAARIMAECNAAMLSVFQKLIVHTHQGYYLDSVIGSTTAGRAQYRIPGRAIVGGLEKVEIADADGVFRPLTECTTYESADYEGPYNAVTQGPPQRYVMEGDQVRLLPAPDHGNYKLRLRYYRRPGRIVTQQCSTLGGGTVRGTVTAVNTTARTITVDVLPFDQELATPAAITSGAQRIDVIHSDGWRDLALTGATQTYVGLVFTVGGTADMSEIEVGDFVRVAEQADWPSLPDDAHGVLADTTAVVILTSLGLEAKASALAQKMGTDLQRLQSMIRPRVKDAHPPIKPRYGSYLHRRQRFWP